MEAATQAKIPKTFRLERDLVRALEARSKETGRNQTEIVAECLSGELTASEKGSKAGGDSRGSGEAITEAAPVQAPFQGPGESRRAPTGESADGAVPSAGAPPVPLAVWLADRTGQPRSLCRLFISQGRVAVDGEVFTNPAAAAPLGGVSLDGEPV